MPGIRQHRAHDGSSPLSHERAAHQCTCGLLARRHRRKSGQFGSATTWWYLGQACEDGSRRHTPAQAPRQSRWQWLNPSTPRLPEMRSVQLVPRAITVAQSIKRYLSILGRNADLCAITHAACTAHSVPPTFLEPYPDLYYPWPSLFPSHPRNFPCLRPAIVTSIVAPETGCHVNKRDRGPVLPCFVPS